MLVSPSVSSCDVVGGTVPAAELVGVRSVEFGAVVVVVVAVDDMDDVGCCW